MCHSGQLGAIQTSSDSGAWPCNSAGDRIGGLQHQVDGCGGICLGSEEPGKFSGANRKGCIWHCSGQCKDLLGCDDAREFCQPGGGKGFGGVVEAASSLTTGIGFTGGQGHGVDCLWISQPRDRRISARVEQGP